ncbi:hypothetical protein [Rhizocola hellebori]|nr:hypothetical protein [Rhizocola hellebori]
MPATLRIAIVVLWAQFLAVLGLFAIYVVLLVRDPSILAFYVGAFGLIFTAALFFMILALGRFSTAARGGVFALELIVLAPAYYMITGGKAWLGLIIGLSAVAVIALLVLPPTNRVLSR